MDVGRGGERRRVSCFARPPSTLDSRHVSYHGTYANPALHSPQVEEAGISNKVMQRRPSSIIRGTRLIAHGFPNLRASCLKKRLEQSEEERSVTRHSRERALDLHQLRLGLLELGLRDAELGTQRLAGAGLQRQR